MMEKYNTAIQVASFFHGGQYRKGNGTPYVLHPLRVAESIRRVWPDVPEYILCAAVLHDVLEDTPADYSSLKTCGAEEGVAGLVLELTRHPDTSRKDYINSFKHVSGEAALIKLADRLDNLCEPGMDREFMIRYVKEARILLENIRECLIDLKDNPVPSTAYSKFILKLELITAPMPEEAPQ